MCRLLLVLADGHWFSDELLKGVNKMVASWKKATEYDSNFFNFEGESKHDDGFGLYRYYLTKNDKNYFSLTKNSEPAFLENQKLEINRSEIKNFILLNHARKASKSMPISINQNHPFVNESGNRILAHNGTLKKKILLEFIKHKPDSIENVSDTQLLFTLLQETFGVVEKSDSQEILKRWKRLISSIRDRHKILNEPYSMNLIFLLKTQNNRSFKLLYSTMYSNPLGENYFKLYSGIFENMRILCSSTVYDYLKIDYPDFFDQGVFNILPNDAMGLIDQEPTVKSEQLLN